MRQRLGVGQAILPRPPVLFLDEPVSALDPAGRRDVLELIGSLRGSATILMSTHILNDIERICDRVAIIDRGTPRHRGRHRRAARPARQAHPGAGARARAGRCRRRDWLGTLRAAPWVRDVRVRRRHRPGRRLGARPGQERGAGRGRGLGPRPRALRVGPPDARGRLPRAGRGERHDTSSRWLHRQPVGAAAHAAPRRSRDDS